MESDGLGLSRLLQILFPPVCALCGGRGAEGLDLCRGCLEDLPYNSTACPRCAIALPVSALCGRCLHEPPTFTSSLSLFRYEAPVDHLIISLKFHRKLKHARLLGELMAIALADRTETLPELLVPVPLHRTRLRERGYNQALEIARPVSRRWRIPIAYRGCHRVRPTSAQARLSAHERRLNVRNAFHIDRSLGARHVAIVDDVVTTGHTVQALALALQRSGVERVEVWSCARAALGNT